MTWKEKEFLKPVKRLHFKTTTNNSKSEKIQLKKTIDHKYYIVFIQIILEAYNEKNVDLKDLIKYLISPISFTWFKDFRGDFE